MAAAWNFPEDYQTVIRLHHTPSAAAIGDPKIAALARAVYLGNKMAKALHLGESTDQHVAMVTPNDLKSMGINKQGLGEIIPQIKNEYAQCLEAWSL